MQLIPALDILGTDAVRLARGNYEQVLFRRPLDTFLHKIVETKPELIHVVDLQGAREGELRYEILERCVSLAGSIPIQFSGGIRSLEVARQVLDTGVARVIVGTAAWQDPESLAKFADTLKSQLLVALDVRDGKIAVRGWAADTGLSVFDALMRCREARVARLHVTAIDRDGTMQGPDLELYRLICESAIPVVAAGGIRDDADLRELEELGCEGAIMGLGYLARLGISLEGML
jgi:phosphoribosylformimino-5-aminoimidazole carboxamide ribotide isomerase